MVSYQCRECDKISSGPSMPLAFKAFLGHKNDVHPAGCRLPKLLR